MNISLITGLSVTLPTERNPEMGRDKSFERQYSINVARLPLGESEDDFEVGADFFTHFEETVIDDAKVSIALKLVKYGTHVDATFQLSGTVSLPCDRCGEHYLHDIDDEQRIIYSFDKDLDFEGYEVMYVHPHEPTLTLVQELYDFIILSVPIRKVPPIEVHLCSPEVLQVLGLDEAGNPLPEKTEEKAVDPRWEQLRKLKDQME